MSVRQRQEVLETLYVDFKEYEFPKDITMASYLEITERGTLRRFIKKTFKTWPRTLRALELTYPDLFTGTTPEANEPEPVDPLAALGSASSVDDSETTDAE